MTFESGASGDARIVVSGRNTQPGKRWRGNRRIDTRLQRLRSPFYRRTRSLGPLRNRSATGFWAKLAPRKTAGEFAAREPGETRVSQLVQSVSRLFRGGESGVIGSPGLERSVPEALCCLSFARASKTGNTRGPRDLLFAGATHSSLTGGVTGVSRRDERRGGDVNPDGSVVRECWCINGSICECDWEKEGDG